jgi:hypothetical protein
MHPTRRWIVISLAVALLLGAAWYAQHSTLPRRVSRSTPSAEAPSIPGHLRAAARPSAAVRHPGVEGGETTKATGRETLVCGVGAVRIDEKSRAAPFNYVDRVTGPAQGRWQRNLINSDDYRERATGLALLSAGWDYDSVTGMPTPTHDAVLARDELVQLAAGQDDPSVYAMAVHACDQTYDPAPRDAACDRISLTKWAAMDPDNAAPWLEIAARAHARSDQAAVFEAIGHAALAHSIDFGHDALLAYASIGMPPETSRLERAAFFDRLIGQKSGEGPVRALSIGQYCTEKAEQEPSVRQQCEALAELMADHGRNTSDLSTAASVGARLGWAPERIAALRQETLAVFRVESHSQKDPWSCDDERAVNEFADLQARSGELAAARAAISKSGKPIPQLAQEQLDSVRKATEEDCSLSGGTLKVLSGGALSMCEHGTTSQDSNTIGITPGGR